MEATESLCGGCEFSHIPGQLSFQETARENSRKELERGKRLECRKESWSLSVRFWHYVAAVFAHLHSYR